jgi:hypothetical protein
MTAIPFMNERSCWSRCDRHAAHPSRGFRVAGSGAFGPAVMLSAARSRHHQRIDSCLFCWTRSRWLLARPRRQGRERRYFPVQELGAWLCAARLTPSRLRDDPFVRAVRARRRKSGQSADRLSQAAHAAGDGRLATNGCRDWPDRQGQQALIEVFFDIRWIDLAAGHYW